VAAPLFRCHCRWYVNELPKELAQANSLTHEQLVKLVEWKLARGKWRPRLLDFAKAADGGAVADASLRALAQLRKLKGARCSAAVLKEAMAPLIELRGVGPATASAVLSAVDPSVPFMSDEALAAALGTKQYTVAAAGMLMEALQAKAAALTAAGGRVFSARDVESALFSESAAMTARAKLPTAKKRKR
jgi:hypothetical protein